MNYHIYIGFTFVLNILAMTGLFLKYSEKSEDRLNVSQNISTAYRKHELIVIILLLCSPSIILMKVITFYLFFIQ